MMPKTLIEVGLAPALKDMFAQSFELAGIAHEFEEVNADRRFDSRIEVAIYRIAQELTTNVIKHAAASEVRAELICAAGQITLLITDNGKGLNKKLKSGLGIQNMESRAQQVNGVLSIESAGGQGTTAHLRIKLAAQ
jgi:signal transduction histidine kinase